ncbi:MAG: AsmA family protein [Desulfobacterales bacterium]|nr:AsmA family protein [Desulfobacterales bacterium]
MGKLGKIFSVLVLLFVIAVAGLAAFVHYYLTDERVKAFIIPQAEAALGRKVAIGDIKIGLLSGITIRDFLIKEVDSDQNFVSARAFVLSYDLMPLLQKKVVISEIRFDEPTVQILRDKNGQFNFSSLALLSEEGDKKEKKESGASTTALPVALTFNQISFNRAQIKIRDLNKEIPDVDATTSAQLNVALGRTLKDLQYKGSFDVDAAVEFGTAKTQIKGKGNINQKDLDIILDTNLGGEQVHVEADVKSYMQAPNATINISSKSLNIDKLLAIAAGLPKSSSAKTVQPKTNKSTEIIADSLPPGLVANGTVKVDKALYKGITTSDFALIFNLSKGIFTVKELSAQAYSGKLDSNLVVDLNQPGLAYNGNLGLESVQAGDLGSAFVQKAAGMLNGSLQSAMTFSGAGTSWEELKNVLNADGSFTLVDGGIKGTPVSSSISTILGLQELNNITYKNITGTFKVVEGGKVKIKSNLQGADLDAEAEGIIGLDGSLDLPLTLHLSPALADKLKSRGSFTKYLTDEQGGSTLHFKLTGNLKSPKPTLDMKASQDQIQKAIQNEIFNKTDSPTQETDKKESPASIIKRLFGK